MNQGYTQQQQYQQQQYQQPQYQQPQYQQPVGNAPSFVTILVLAILQTCCCNTITGITAIILILVANGAYKSGNIDDYESKKKAATIVLIVGVILSIVISIAYYVLMGTAFLTNNFSSFS